MARKPNYKRMYNDALNLLKLKREQLPKPEVKIELPEDFKTEGIEKLEMLLEEVSMRIQFFKENRGTRLVPPTLQILYGRLLRVDEDMRKINKSLVKPLILIEDYEIAYTEVMKELEKVVEQVNQLELEGQQELEG